MDTCESCGDPTKETIWVLVDENMECRMCRSCIKSNRRVVDVDPIDQDDEDWIDEDEEMSA